MCAEREFSTSSQLSCRHDASFCILVHYTKRPVIPGDFCVLCVLTTRYTHITKQCVHLYVKPPIVSSPELLHGFSQNLILVDTILKAVGWNYNGQCWLHIKLQLKVIQFSICVTIQKLVHNTKYRHDYGNLYPIKHPEQ
jgi:hypothetical protein